MTSKNGDLPAKVHRKHGGYYYVHQNKWTRLGGTKDEALENLPAIKEAGLSTVSAKQLNDHLGALLLSCKTRATQYDINFSLTAQCLIEMMNECEWRCSVSGAPFSFSTYGNTEKRPFAPSIDRTDSSKGYTKDNCRMVCAITNIAMNAWGCEPLRLLSKHMVGKAAPAFQPGPTGVRAPEKFKPPITKAQAAKMRRSKLSDQYFANKMDLPVKVVREYRYSQSNKAA